MIRKALKTLAPNPKILGATMVALVIGEIFPFLYPMILARILDGASLHGHPAMLAKLLGLYAGVVILHSLFFYVRMVLAQALSISTTHNLRLKIFTHLQHLPLPYFQRTPVGTLMTRATSDVDSFGSMFSDGILELFANLALLLFSIAFMLWQNWVLGLATLVFFPIMIVISAWYRKQFHSIQTRYRSELSALSAFLQESLNGIGIIQSFRKQTWLANLQRKRNDSYIAVSRQYALRYAGFFPLIQSFSDLSLLACYTGGVYMISRGQLSAGTITAFAWYASIYSRPLRDISDRINTLQATIAAGDRVHELLATATEDDSTESRILTIRTDSAAIKFQNVQFAYHPTQPVLRDLSFLVPQGSRTALVGPTGCGKTTSMQLLLRFLEPQAGNIEIFGTPIAKIQRHSLHQHIAWLGQDPFLFPGTLRENICMGATFDTARFADICTRAQLTELLQEIDAETTLVGTGGRELSSGQRQLVAYARTLYQDPEILLLDEPSASLDAQTEQRLQLALQELLRNRTALLITHRPSSIAVCDQVFLLHEGAIVESGTHQTLLQQNGRYASIFRDI